MIELLNGSLKVTSCTLTYVFHQEDRKGKGVILRPFEEFLPFSNDEEIDLSI